MGAGPAVLDMITGQCCYNAPEFLLAYLAIIEMSHYYDLPNWGYAGTSDSQIPDEQAAFEAGRFLIDSIKDRVPVWKREHFTDGTSEWLAVCPGCQHGHS